MDPQSLPGRSLRQLHPRIVLVAESLFLDGHGEAAAFEALKAVHTRVQLQSGLDASGRDLMTKAFAEDGPIRLSTNVGQVGRDEQEGFRFMFMGAATGLRNPPAHDQLRPTRAEAALDQLGFTSLLMRRLDLAIHQLADLNSSAAEAMVNRIERGVPRSVPGRIMGTVAHTSGASSIRVYALHVDQLGTGYRSEIRASGVDPWTEFFFDEIIPGEYMLYGYSGTPPKLGGRRSNYFAVGLPGDSFDSTPLVEVQAGKTTRSVHVTNWDAPAPKEPDGLSLVAPRLG